MKTRSMDSDWYKKIRLDYNRMTSTKIITAKTAKLNGYVFFTIPYLAK